MCVYTDIHIIIYTYDQLNGHQLSQRTHDDVLRHKIINPLWIYTAIHSHYSQYGMHGKKHTKTMVYHVLTMAHIENISRFGAQASQNMVIGPT